MNQFNIYLMNGDEEEMLDVYGREIIPALRASRPPHRVAVTCARERALKTLINGGTVVNGRGQLAADVLVRGRDDRGDRARPAR